jgi:hypothetical protein
MKKETWIPIFFALTACSWMPHWTCHYYRLETASSFVVGNWNYSLLDSLVAMFIYSVLITLNLLSVSYQGLRFVSALLSGILHLTLGSVHIARLLNPFNFEVFGYSWSMGSSIREIILVFPFGIVCIVMAMYTSRLKRTDLGSSEDRM